MAIPLCPYFGSCGGCSAQHIDYTVQIENKRKVLTQITGCDTIEVFSGKEYFYRNRMDFIFHARGLGLREKGNWRKIIPIEKCVIAEEKIQLFLEEITTFLPHPDAFDLQKQSGTFRYAVIRTTPKTSSISFVLNADSTRIGEAIEKIKEFAKISTAKNILVTYVPHNTDMSVSEDYFVIKGTDMLETSFLHKNFFHHAQGFFQNNYAMAEEMQGYVHKLLSTYSTKEAILLDLFGGVGTFGICNSDLFKETLIVESVVQAIKAAEKNIEKNKSQHTKARLMDAKQIKKLELKRPLYVIADPPRTGMEQQSIQTLKEWQPEVLIYISCNPQQLAKDLPKFKDYEIKSAALFDLFPQTPHSEAIVELQLKSE